MLLFGVTRAEIYAMMTEDSVVIPRDIESSNAQPALFGRASDYYTAMGACPTSGSDFVAADNIV
jgi:hypothetical protein